MQSLVTLKKSKTKPNPYVIDQKRQTQNLKMFFCSKLQDFLSLEQGFLTFFLQFPTF